MADIQNTEKVKDSYIGDTFQNDIDMYLKLFAEENKVEDISSMSQSRWNAAMIYIQNHVFNDRKALNENTLDYNTCSLYPTNYNRLNVELLLNVCNYYIYLCLMYDKEVSITGFSLLCGISYETIYGWGVLERRVSNTCMLIYKNLMHFREESLSGKLLSGNRNPVGVLAVLNRHFCWNMPGVQVGRVEKQALPAAELPRLDAIGGAAASGTSQTAITGGAIAGGG